MKTKMMMTMLALLGMSPVFGQEAKGAASAPADQSPACSPAQCCAAKEGAARPCPPPCCPMGELTVEEVTVAAANGDPIAQYMLAYLTETGRGVPADAAKAAAMYAEAVPNLQKAADAGHAAACKTLAHAYAEGKGVSPDPARAQAYRMKAGKCHQPKGCCQGPKGHGAAKGCCQPAPAAHDAPADAPAAAPAAEAAEVVEVTVGSDAAPDQGE